MGGNGLNSLSCRPTLSMKTVRTNIATPTRAMESERMIKSSANLNGGPAMTPPGSARTTPTNPGKVRTPALAAAPAPPALDARRHRGRSAAPAERVQVGWRVTARQGVGVRRPKAKYKIATPLSVTNQPTQTQKSAPAGFISPAPERLRPTLPRKPRSSVRKTTGK